MCARSSSVRRCSLISWRGAPCRSSPREYSAMRVDAAGYLALLVATLGACAPREARRPSAAGAPAPSSLPASSTESPKVPASTWFVPYFGISSADGSAWSPDGKWALLRQDAERALLLGTSQAAPVAGLPIPGDWSAAA